MELGAFVRLDLFFPCSTKLFNLLSTDNYLRKIVSGRVYGIFFFVIFIIEKSREKQMLHFQRKILDVQ